MKHLKLINPENVTEDEVKSFKVRNAARAVVLDSDGKIAFMYAGNRNYWKLPGGGIEDGEDKITALKRECMEEIGCDVEVLAEVGIITEYRRMFGIKQTSYCYVARVVGEKGTPNFTQHEITEGFAQFWLSYDEAVEKIVGSKATNLEGAGYIVPRDTIFLEEAKQYLK